MENKAFEPDDFQGSAVGNGSNGSVGFELKSKRKISHDGSKPKSAENLVEKTVSVLGSGDYGRAIASRFVKAGFTVCIGSRDPNCSSVKKLVRQSGAALVSQQTAAVFSQVVVVAVGRDHYDSLPTSLLRGKILIDVSNNVRKRKGPNHRSNAEYLQNLIPDSLVVKGFNVLSAYSLESGALQGSKEVAIAGDSAEAKVTVFNIVRAMGFIPVDWGSLKAARDIENIPLQFMRSWKRPSAVVFGLFAVQWLYALISFQICPNAQSGRWSQNWKHLSLQNLNRVLGTNSLWVLSFCYLPGLLAAYIQLWRGTKYSRFPKWLDDWLKMRKQLGLLMLAMASIHACLSLAFITPQTDDWVYEAPKVVKALVTDGNVTNEEDVKLYNFALNWRGELFLSLGAISLCLLVILGVTSLPSVTSSLTWREFSFIQSKLGWVALVLASLHDVFLAWKYIFIYWGCFGTIPIGPQYALYAPFICVVLKVPLLLPPIDKYLQRIRRGYERKDSKRKPEIP